jgi:hypothetical protein
MGNNGDLKATVEALAKAVTALQATVEANTKALEANAKAIAALTYERSSSSGSKPFSGEHHQDWPPKFQKMDFPRYDGKSDPLIFINRCESYFHQQWIMEEEKVWMASYNLEEGAQMWYIQVQTDEGTPLWRRFKELINLWYGPPLHATPSSSSPTAAVPPPSRSTRTASRRSFPALAPSTRRSGCSCSRAAFFLRSASTCRSRTRSPSRPP